MAVGFAATFTVTLPFPFPPPDTEIHSLFDEPVQLQPVGAVTDTELVTAALPTERFVELRVKEQATGACVTVTVCPAIVTVPVRWTAAGFAAMFKDTVSFPKPEPPPDTVIHSLLDEAVQLHPAGAVTDTEPFPEPLPTDRLVVLRVKEQATGACVTVTVCPAIVTVPVRWVALGFASMAMETVPSPEPGDPPDIAIQPVFEDAVHAQPAGADTDTVALAAPLAAWILAVFSV
jgi:hypothetical protein